MTRYDKIVAAAVIIEHQLVKCSCVALAAAGDDLLASSKLVAEYADFYQMPWNTSWFSWLSDGREEARDARVMLLLLFAEATS